MNETVLSGLFVIAGAVVGGLSTYLAALAGQKRESARSEIVRLCDQVASFYELEQLYKIELASLDPEHRSAKKIMEDMRSRVEDLGKYERPRLTSNAAKKIKRKWSK